MKMVSCIYLNLHNIIIIEHIINSTNKYKMFLNLVGRGAGFDSTEP